MVRAKAEALLLSDLAIVQNFYNYQISRGLAMNMIFTISAMRQDQETLDFLATFRDSKLSKNR